MKRYLICNETYYLWIFHTFFNSIKKLNRFNKLKGIEPTERDLLLI